MPVYRSTYHYGNLRAALTDAALELARRGGPPAVTVRGVARSVGVTPPAAYRHFTEVEELLTATKDRALILLAERVDAAIGAAAAMDAAACLRAVAEAYVGFARSCPGLFAMACHGSPETIRVLITDRLGPFLNALSARRPGMAFALWSAVHALAVLAAEGVSRGVPQDEVLDTVLAWIAGGVGVGGER
ncbi:AcrR family transcriptional regulator [Catenulispora sp. GP43]|uniref:TetR/AcrR family transcriptional regulator n=1 Tax=Catenulispora sp. GP43 TaxID=3156263 RepID=UPI0035195410